MGSVINVNKSAYTENALIENWSEEFVRQNIRLHSEREELDHCDGCVTERKLSGKIREKIEDALGGSQIAQERAVFAEAKADAAAASAGVAIEKADAAMKEAGDALAYGINILDARINEVEIRADEALTIASHNAENKADKSELPQKVSQLENDAEYVTVDQASEMNYGLYNFILGDINSLWEDKADKVKIATSGNASYTFDFSDKYNSEMRMTSPSAITIEFKDDEYEPDYISGLSFNCGETPTAFDYTASGIINWVGTDTSTFTYQVSPEGDTATISLFIPSPNTHYDIVFYFNGVQFIGLVNGFVPATGNEAV